MPTSAGHMPRGEPSGHHCAGQRPSDVPHRSSSHRTRSRRARPDHPHRLIVGEPCVQRSVRPCSVRGRGRAGLLGSDGDRFRIQCEGKPPFEWTIGRTGSWTDVEGESFTVTLSRLDQSLNLTFQGEKGSKRFTYRFGPTDLRVTQQVSSEQLPAPMTWSPRRA